jgi:hypothetical protein
MAIKISGDTVIFDDKVFRVGSGTTAQRPQNPEVGMVRFNTDLDSLEGYNGVEWGPIGGGGGAEISETAPSDPDAGDLWWDSTSGTLKIYYDDGNSAQWVDASPTLQSDFVEDVYVPPFDFTSASLGDAACGGIYMGTIAAAGTCYYLIVAPNATGCALCQWKTANNTTAGTGSLTDGYANTYGPMDNADHPAGNWCATRTINGFSDWYLPAIDELETFYNNGATGEPGSNESVIGTGEAFVSGIYWSSTEAFGFSACALNFFNGSRTSGGKAVSCNRVRAVRREPI